MSCTVDTHPQLAAIEAALRSGISQRQVAQQFGLSKSSLGRHVAHASLALTPVSESAAPPLDPGPEPPVTVAAIHARITTLEEERATLRSQHEETTAQRQVVAQELPRLRFLERRQQVSRREQELLTLDATLARLSAALGTCDATLHAAHELLQEQGAREADARKQHFLCVQPRLSDPMLAWCCRLCAEPSVSPGSPPLPPGRTLVEYDYPALCQQIRTQYPWDGNCPCRCPVCSSPPPAPVTAPAWEEEHEVIIYDWIEGQMVPRAASR